MPRIRPLSLIVVVGLLVSACSGGADPTEPGGASSTPSVPSPTYAESSSDEPTATPTEEPTETPNAQPGGSPSPTLVELPGGFTVHANAEADSLFLDRDTCSNEQDNYEVSFPEAWYTNTEIGRNPACIWFSPTDYDVPDPSVVPDEIAITIEWFPGDVGRTDANIVDREDLIVGGQASSRVEWDDGAYWYVIQLGPTPEEGPNVLVVTSPEMGGDYELNRAVMDRMMSTIEFFGSID